MLDRRADLAFDICFCVANVPVITVLNEIGVLDRRADLAFHIVFPIANVLAITVLGEIGVLDRRADPALHIGFSIANILASLCRSQGVHTHIHIMSPVTERRPVQLLLGFLTDHSGRNCVRKNITATPHHVARDRKAPGAATIWGPCRS